MSESKDFYWTYDGSSDVLHITMDPMIPCYGEPLRNFENVLILMRDAETEKVVGLRILAARANRLNDIRVLIDKEKRAFQGIHFSRLQDEHKESKGFLQELEEIDRILSSPPKNYDDSLFQLS